MRPYVVHAQQQQQQQQPSGYRQPEHQARDPTPTRRQRIVLAEWQLVVPSATILRVDEYPNKVKVTRSCCRSTSVPLLTTTSDGSINLHLRRLTSRTQGHGRRNEPGLANYSSVAKVDSYSINESFSSGGGVTFAPDSGRECCSDRSQRSTLEEDTTVSTVANNNNSDAGASSWRRKKYRPSLLSIVVQSTSLIKTETTPLGGTTNIRRPLHDVKDGTGVRKSFGMSYPDPMSGAPIGFVQRMDAIHALQTNTIRHERNSTRRLKKTQS